MAAIVGYKNDIIGRKNGLGLSGFRLENIIFLSVKLMTLIVFNKFYESIIQKILKCSGTSPF